MFQGECDPALGSEFQFTIHSKELIVGEIFVRIYNEQPTFPLEVSIKVKVKKRYIVEICPETTGDHPINFYSYL